MEQPMSQPTIRSAPAALGRAERSTISPALRRKARPGEAVIQAILRVSGLLSVLITAGIVLVLLYDAFVFFMRPEVNLWGFLTGTAWQPRIDQFLRITVGDPTQNTALITALTQILA